MDKEQPQRIQLRRTKGWRMPPNTVKVDRTTLFGNPFSAEQHGRTGAVRMFQLWLEGKLPEGSFPDWAMHMLMTKRPMVLDALPRLREEPGVLVSATGARQTGRVPCRSVAGARADEGGVGRRRD